MVSKLKLKNDGDCSRIIILKTGIIDAIEISSKVVVVSIPKKISIKYFFSFSWKKNLLILKNNFIFI